MLIINIFYALIFTLIGFLIRCYMKPEITDNDLVVSSISITEDYKMKYKIKLTNDEFIYTNTKFSVGDKLKLVKSD